MILITGAAGFIGSAVAYGLNRRGRFDLVLCDALGEDERWKNLLGLRFRTFVHRDELFYYLTTAPDARSIQAVIHLGACSDTTETDMDYLFENNVLYSIRLCQWALRRKKPIRFIYASSAAVYGDGHLGFSDEEEVTPRLKPLNKYGFSKWMFDMWALENNVIHKVAGLRYFNVFGPNEYHKGMMASVIFRSFPQAHHDGRLRLFESHRPDVAHGEQARDFVYIEDAVAMTLFILDHATANGFFNIGTGRAHTFNELAHGVFEGLGKKPVIEYFPMPEELRSRYQYFTQADMRRLQAAGFPRLEDRFHEQVVRYVSRYLTPGYLRLQEVET
ncbi:MAG: ADP-glyceromanno-heptose 6-epimerase [Desulfobacterota bacterium]|nr:ADP-glyceromanno-heptose 6-epimerase [Thermodesulfobacteriota bacterium]